MKLFNFLVSAILITSLFAQGCGSSGDASKVTKDQYKKIMFELNDTTKKNNTLESILKAKNIKAEDFTAAATEFSKDTELMKEINKVTEESMAKAGKETDGAGDAEEEEEEE